MWNIMTKEELLDFGLNWKRWVSSFWEKLKEFSTPQKLAEGVDRKESRCPMLSNAIQYFNALLIGPVSYGKPSFFNGYPRPNLRKLVHGQGEDKRRQMFEVGDDPPFRIFLRRNKAIRFGIRVPETSDLDVHSKKPYAWKHEEDKVEQWDKQTMVDLRKGFDATPERDVCFGIDAAAKWATEILGQEDKRYADCIFLSGDLDAIFFVLQKRATTGFIGEGPFGVSLEKISQIFWQTKGTRRGVFIVNDPSMPPSRIAQTIRELERHKNSLDEPDRASLKMYLFANHHFPTPRLISMWNCIDTSFMMDFGRNPMATEHVENSQNLEMHEIVISADNATDDINDKTPPNELEMLTTEPYRQSEQLRREHDMQMMEIEEALQRILHHLEVQTKVGKRRRCHASA